MHFQAIAWIVLTFGKILFIILKMSSATFTTRRSLFWTDTSGYECEIALINHTKCRINQLITSSRNDSSRASFWTRLPKFLEKLNSDITDITRGIEDGALEKRKLCYSGAYGVFGYPKPPVYPIQEEVQFLEPFETKPAMTYGITKVDASQTDYLWALVSIEHITNTGFTIVFNKYRDTVMYGVNITWMACPN